MHEAIYWNQLLCVRYDWSWQIRLASLGGHCNPTPSTTTIGPHDVPRCCRVFGSGVAA